MRAGTSRKSIFLGATGVMAGATILSAAATQFVAYRVGYHPAIGAPLIAHIYPPWNWVAWQSAAWAGNAKRTFQIVDVALFAATALPLFSGLLYAAIQLPRGGPARNAA